MAKETKRIPHFNPKGNKSPSKGISKQSPVKKPVIEDPRLLGAIIIFLTFFAFFPSLKNDFILSWDDNAYVTENPIIRHLNLQSIQQMFTKQVNGTYVPLPLLSYAIEYHFFGSNPLPFHVTNLLFHLFSTLLVFQLFRLLKINIIYAAFGAILFGIHPMRVESVAWISERKDVLYCFFYLAALATHVKFILAGKKGIKYYLLTLLLFSLALLSKIEAVALPLSLLLIDYFMERPLKLRLIIEKIPHFLLALVIGCFGIFFLNQVDLFSINKQLVFTDRLFYGLLSLNVYIAKFFVPYIQSALYPYPVTPGNTLPLYCYLNPILTAVLVFIVYKTAHFTRAVVFGSLFFFVNVIFVLQIVAAGVAFLSDRYTYVAYTGIIFIIVWALEQLARKKNERKQFIYIGISAYLVVFLFITYNRCEAWNNGETLWSDVIKKYPDEITVSYLNRGFAYGDLGQPEKAISDYTKAIEINPNYGEAYYNRGIEYDNLKQRDRAIADYNRAIEINPNYNAAYSNRGNTFGKLGQWEKAISDYTRAIEIKPDYKEAYVNRGAAYGNLGQWDKAIDDYSKAIGNDPDYKEAYLDRGFAYGKLGKPDKAMKDFDKALYLDTNYKEAYFSRGNEYENLMQWDKAISDYTKAIRIDPNYETAYSNRGIAYGNLGQWDNAINDFTNALMINPNFTVAYNNREIAYKNLQKSTGRRKEQITSK